MSRILLSVLTALAIISTTQTVGASGILVPEDENLPPLRITDHLVDVEIHDSVALTTLNQTFHNDNDHRVEATYVFPLPENADLTNFEMSFNGKMVKGEVLDADKARETYESIVRQAKDPGLIEFIGHRLLKMRVFPIEPNSDTTVKIKYQQICQSVSGMNGYHYPLRTRDTAGQAYGTVRFAVDLESNEPIKTIWSPTHSVEIVRDGENNAKVAYEASGGSLEDDFLLLYDAESSDLGLSVIAHTDNSRSSGTENQKTTTSGSESRGTFLLILTPKQLWPEESHQPQDVVFVIDTSGSMAGKKIEQAKESLKFCIDKLDERDRFSVVRFSTGFDLLFDQVKEATPDNRDKARAMIENFEASGGTNITDTLQQVMSMRDTNGSPALRAGSDKSTPGSVNRGTGNTDDTQRPFVVVFLTDGKGNRTPDEIMTTVNNATSENSENIRVFPFGVGHDVNTKLLDRLSTTLSGTPTYVQPGENLELVLGDFFSIISEPVLTNLTLNLPEINATEQFPPTLGDLYKGQQLIVAGKFRDAASGKVKLTAMREGKEVEYVWPDVSFASTEDAEYVEAIWAGRKIAYLLDQIRMHGENEEMINEIVALATEHGIQTPYTSWLVTPEQQRQLARRNGRGIFATPRGNPQRPSHGGGGGLGSGAAGGTPPSREVADRLGQFQDAPEAGLDEALEQSGREIRDLREGVSESSGRAANVFAEHNARMRKAGNLDTGRADSRLMARRKFNDTWYNRINGFLVDENFNEDTEMTTLNFGSDAYFELIAKRSDLRPVFTANRHVVIMMNKDHAIVIVDKDGLEKFSPKQREQFNLPAS